MGERIVSEQAVILTPLDETKEAAVRELEHFLKTTWQEYGVNEYSLSEEMQTWYWKRIPIGRKYHDVLAWKGIGVTLAETIEKYKLGILAATDLVEVALALERAKKLSFTIACYLWSLGKATGPPTPVLLMKRASKADSLADYHERRGHDKNAESQRRRADILRRQAAGEDIELPKRASGTIDKVRAIYSELEKDGQRPRSELIQAAIAAGIHPGTAAVQYAKRRKEQRENE